MPRAAKQYRAQEHADTKRHPDSGDRIGVDKRFRTLAPHLPLVLDDSGHATGDVRRLGSQFRRGTAGLCRALDKLRFCLLEAFSGKSGKAIQQPVKFARKFLRGGRFRRR